MTHAGGLIQSRSIVVERLAQDLVGPQTPDEFLLSRPSDVYLAGILWPQNTAVEASEDEALSTAPVAGEAADDSDEAARPAGIGMKRPSTAGISFAVSKGADGNSTIEICTRLALYRKEENNLQVQANQDAKSDVKVAAKVGWRRYSVEPPPLVVPIPGAASDFPVPACPDGVRINIRTVSFGSGRLVTVTLVNGATPDGFGRTEIEECTLFQVALEVRAVEGCNLIARPSRKAVIDDDDRSAALLFRDAHEFAVGHTCAADWELGEDAQQSIAMVVRSNWLPMASVPAMNPDGHAVFASLSQGDSDPLSAAWLSGAKLQDLVKGLSRVATAYANWITLKEKQVTLLAAELQATAGVHIKEARHVLARIQGGIARLETDVNVAEAFQLANKAMDMQRRWSGAAPLRWRPFQLAFVLLSLESTLDGSHVDRSVMDLLWFPTGGGKTEAYLALVAMVAFHRRLSQNRPDDGAGVAVIMRYTLRLLTTQQFLRASAVTCACEVIRRERAGGARGRKLGSVPFSIGLWVGGDATPNRREEAFQSQADQSLASPMQLMECPACHTALRATQASRTDPFTVNCNNSQCPLGASVPLPVWTVDDDVYTERPTLLIGTVDKFAQIVRNPATAGLFAVRSGLQPQLILQDELHLISGPLGTLAGLYESAIDLILSTNGSKPKIIGSTATIRRAPEQVLALFDRDTCQFPPPGLDASDSGFAVPDTRPDAPARCFVGVSTVGRSAKFTLQAVSASLLQAAAALPAAQQDSYWTLLAYFNALRELGGALVLMQDDVRDSLNIVARQRGESPRPSSNIEEMTSRRNQREIRDMLDTLEIPAGDPRALDVVLSTNMVSVGVDFRRLGLMLMNGQPKTTAEYIQATSRVGRGKVPGLVVTVLNAAKPRDRSHFESFRTWHSILYREVEATSVTPFASRARDRALHAVLVALARHVVPGMLDTPVLDDVKIAAIEAVIEQVCARAQRVDPLETDVRDELLERLRSWERRVPSFYWKRPDDSLMQSAEAAAARQAAGRLPHLAWPTLNSLRGVEPATPFQLKEVLR